MSSSSAFGRANSVLTDTLLPFVRDRRDGVKTGAVDGLVRLLERMNKTHRPAHICVFFDSPKRPTTRKLMSPSYKSSRPPTLKALRSQFTYAKELLLQGDVHCFEYPGFEADDLIASYTRVLSSAGHDVLIISNDNDFLQLARDSTNPNGETNGDSEQSAPADEHRAGSVELYQPNKRRYLRERSLTGRFGLRPALLPDMYALCGDRWGKIPRVANLTDERAIELLNQYGGLFSLLRQLDSLEDVELRRALKHGISSIETSHRLAKLNDEVSLPLAIEDLLPPQLDKLAVVMS